MKTFSRAAKYYLIAITIASYMLADEPNKGGKVITYSDLVSEKVVVTGMFDVPLGKVFNVEGTLVRARDTLGAMYNSAFLLSIDVVDGRKLEQPKRIFFSVKDVGAKLPEGLVELESWKKEELKRSLTDDERKELIAQYVGRRYKLSVVENGHFAGLPKDLPRNCVLWAEEQYRFDTALVVIAGGPM